MNLRTRLIASLTAALILTAASAPAALGHSQKVTPPGVGEAVVDGPISNPWAQAHCNASSPAIVAERSNGVVQFLPATALPCPPIANPGGQVHGD